MDDYRSIIAWAVSQLPRTADEARHAVYEQARTALHKRLGNDVCRQNISDIRFDILREYLAHLV